MDSALVLRTVTAFLQNIAWKELTVILANYYCNAVFTVNL